MGDQVQELGDFGLEGMGVFRHSGYLKGNQQVSYMRRGTYISSYWEQRTGTQKGQKGQKFKKY